MDDLRLQPFADPTTRLDGYFYNHAVGLFPGQREALSTEMVAFSEAWTDAINGQWAYAEQIYAEYLKLWSGLINAPVANLAPSENVTSAVMNIIGSLPASALKDKKVLIAADCFPSLYFLLDALQERYGFELKCVGEKGTRYPVAEEEYLAAWTDDVGFAIVTWVSSTTSARVNLDKLVSHGKSMGTLVCADVTQGVGIVPFDALESGVNFAVSTSLKWICGGPGAGIIYAAPETVEKCLPEFRGWYGQEDPFDWNLDSFDVAEGGRRFLNGTPSYWPYAAALPGLRWHAQVGIDSIFDHNRLITEQILNWAVDRNLELVTPEASELRGGSVMLLLPEKLDPPALISELKVNGIFADNRSRVLRLSPGITCEASGLERLFSVLERNLAKMPNRNYK